MAGVAVALSAAAPAAAAPDFADWLTELRAEAAGRGVSQETLAAALDGVAPLPRVIELDRYQPEFTQTFWTYMDKRVSPRRVELGREMLAKHRRVLDSVQRKYGVQPRFLLAFWGLETNYGSYLGDFPTISALATLAHDARRAGFFRDQLLTALEILDDGHIGVGDMNGSWAGAMGQVQFIPTTFAAHAVDHDGDGRRDIWTSLPDAFASAANFLRASGWRGDETWGREVRLPDGFDFALLGTDVSKPLSEWQDLGVRRIDGRELPIVAGMRGSVVAPSGAGGPAFLVYGNFRATLRWNNSILYALSVGHLADRIAGRGPLQSPRREEEQPLSRAQVAEIQRLLGARGLAPGPADGVIGARTRAAIKRFQRDARLPADGHANLRLLETLKGTP